MGDVDSQGVESRGLGMDTSGVEEWGINIGRPQQRTDLCAPEDDAFTSAIDEFRRDAPICRTGSFEDPSPAQLFVDDAMNGHAMRLRRDDDLEPVLFFKAPSVERLLHRESSSQEANPSNPRGRDPICRGVSDVQELDREARFQLWSDSVHRVCAQHEELGTRRFEHLREARQQFARTAPLARPLKLFNLLKIEAVEEERRRTKTPQPFTHDAVDGLIVKNRRFPTHPAQKSYGLHSIPSGVVATARPHLLTSRS